MKQLKIVTTDYTAKNNFGLIDANFQQNIEIAPYSSIALDKISMDIIPNGTGIINLQQDYTIKITTQTRPANQATNVRSFVLPAGSYTYSASGSPAPSAPTSPDIFKVLTNLSNGILNSKPSQVFSTTSPLSDTGLGFKWIGTQLTANAPILANLHVYQAPWDTTTSGFDIVAPILPASSLTLANVTSAVDTMTPSDIGAYSGYTTLPILQGALLCSVLPYIRDMDEPSSSVSIGLGFIPTAGQPPVVQYGLLIRKLSSGGVKAFYLNDGVIASELNAEQFLNVQNQTLNFCVDETKGHLRMKWGNTTAQISPINTFTSFDFNQAYAFMFSGNRVGATINEFSNFRCLLQPGVTQNEIGIVYKHEPSPFYLTAPNLGAIVPLRTILVDFSESPGLIGDLGFNASNLTGNVSVTAPYIVTATDGLTFVNWYDLAIDINNLSLESYIASSGGTTIRSGKSSAVAYFVMTPLSTSTTGTTSSVFYAETKQLVFLSIANKSSLNVSSLQFRIYEVATGKPVNFGSASFNLFIADRSDDGGHSPYGRNGEHNVASF